MFVSEKTPVTSCHKALLLIVLVVDQHNDVTAGQHCLVSFLETNTKIIEILARFQLMHIVQYI